ncbi:MAG: hypothetical protein JNL11_16520 [Bdellovibrionaceae bacterium]|nr:hypothetical protein [Pseudobdellovibrionaceae bacterium]
MNPTLAEIAQAAQRLGYSSSHPAALPSHEFLLLHGKNKSLLINKTRSPFLSSVHAKLVTDKHLSGEMLKAAGFPMAPKILSHHFSNTDIVFLETHKEIVVKPNRMDRGLGVTDGVQTVVDLKQSYTSAAAYGSVVLEKHIRGKEYRILVINGQAVAALERKPLALTGDGHSTIQELINQMNQDPRRGSANDRKPLRPIRTDVDMKKKLEKIGFNLRSILPANQIVQISFSNHLDSGGIASDCTDTAHPDNLKIAEEAARLFSIDVAGIDLICPNITDSIKTSVGHAAILEVNPGPDIIWHLYPAEGKSRPVAEQFINYIFQN